MAPTFDLGFGVGSSFRLQPSSLWHEHQCETWPRHAAEETGAEAMEKRVWFQKTVGIKDPKKVQETRQRVEAGL